VIDPRQFGAAEFQKATGADTRAMEAMTRYQEMLAEWSGRMNLVGPSALEQFWLRHAYDSAQLLALAPGAKQWVDVGSGAGLPGLVLAILGRDTPGMSVQLVETTEKRCAFLRAVALELELPAIVTSARVEAVRPAHLDIITARAVAPLARLLDLTQHLFRGDAQALFLKGRSVEAEISEALQSWRFDYGLSPSLSDAEGRVLRIRSLRRASA